MATPAMQGIQLPSFSMTSGSGSGAYQSPYAGQTTDPNQSPIMPEFNQIYNPETMSLANQMSPLLSSVQYNQQPLQQLQANAESTAPSAWAQLASQQARLGTEQAASQSAGQTAGQTAQAQGNLAMSGGLSSGANERTQEAGEQAGIGAQQGIMNAGNQSQLGISEQDAANKQQEMNELPGMETQAYQANLEPIQMYGQALAQDTQDAMANNQALNQFNMSAYGNQASMYGANQTANAQEQTAQNTGGLFGGGGFLGLGSWLCTERNRTKKLSSDDKFLLSQLLRFSRKFDRDFTKWYLSKGQTLVTLMKATGDEWRKENDEFIDQILEKLSQGAFEDAFRFYKKHVYSLCDRYWPRIKGVAA